MCNTGLFDSEFFREFAREFRMNGFSENTILCTCYHSKKFLRVMKISPCRAANKHVRDYIIYLKNRKNYSPRSIQANIQSLKRFYGFLHRTGQILADPTCNIKTHQVKTLIPKTILSAREMKAIRTAVSGTSLLHCRDKAIIEVLYSTGLRLSELVGLDISDLDLRAGLLRVQKGKGGRDRRAVLNPDAVSAVNTYLELRIQTLNQTQALWINYKEQRLSGQMIRKILNKYAQKAGVKTPAHPHAWRHGLATALLRQGANIVEVQTFLGHASIKSTQIYTHVLIRDLNCIHRRCHPREKDPVPSDIVPVFHQNQTFLPEVNHE